MTATTAMVHIRLDTGIKDQATKALEAMGLSMSDAVRAFLTRVAVEKQIPFALRVPNATTLAAMRETDLIFKKGNARFQTGEELFDALSEKAGIR